MSSTHKIVVIGSSNMDIVIPVQWLPVNGETLAGGDFMLFPGGKGANQACAVSKLGHGVSFVAQVGADAFGDTMLGSLRESGVDVNSVGVSERASGCALIFVMPGGENSIVISPGANAELHPAIAVERLQTIEHPEFVLLQLEVPEETVASVLEYSRANHIKTILDPAPARPLPKRLLENVDILTPNQTEAAALLGLQPLSVSGFAEAESVATSLLELGPQVVIIKLGALGCLVATREHKQCVPGFSVDAVDTTAAGDAFNGALAVALSEGRSLEDAAVFANASAALSVTRHGAQSSLPMRCEVDELSSRLKTREARTPSAGRVGVSTR